MQVGSIVSGGLAGVGLALGVWWSASPDAARSDSSVSETSTVEARDTEVELATTEEASSSARREASASIASVEIDPDFGRVLAGRVVDPDGRPVVDVEYRVEGPGGLVEQGRSRSGSWMHLDAVPGVYRIELERAGFYGFKDTIEVDGAATTHVAELTPAIVLPVRFETPDGEALEVGQMSDGWSSALGLFVDDEPPVADVAFGSGRVSGGPLATLELRSYFGSDALEGLGARYQGLLQLAQPPPLWGALTWGQGAVESFSIDGSEHELVFVVDRSVVAPAESSVRVRVVAASTGEALDEGVWLRMAQVSLDNTRTVDGESVVFGALPPGRFRLGVTPPEELRGEVVRFEKRVRVPPGTELDLGTIVLPRPATVEVVVRDASGAPRRGANVRLAPEFLIEGPEDVRSAGRSVQTDESGTARFASAASGPAQLLVTSDEFGFIGRRVEVVDGASIEVATEPAHDVTFAGLDALPDGSGRYVESEEGVALAVWGAEPVRLSAGAYQLVVIRGGTEVHRQAFAVSDGRVVVEVAR